MTLHGSYDYRLVVVSVALAMLASYAALDLAGRVTAAHRRSQLAWLTGGALAMGLGIWAMHYVGMLAFSLPVPILYHYPTVLLSLLAAIAASAVALFTVSRERMGAASFIAGSLVMGSGIAAMHYIGMAAMRTPAMMEYHWRKVAALHCAGGCDFSGGFLCLSAFERKVGGELAKNYQRSDYGERHPPHALHRNVGGRVPRIGRNPGPDQRGQYLRTRRADNRVVILMLAVAIVTSFDRLLFQQKAMRQSAGKRTPLPYSGRGRAGDHLDDRP